MNNYKNKQFNQYQMIEAMTVDPMRNRDTSVKLVTMFTAAIALSVTTNRRAVLKGRRNGIRYGGIKRCNGEGVVPYTGTISPAVK